MRIYVYEKIFSENVYVYTYIGPERAVTVGELKRELEFFDPDMEVRLYVEYQEQEIKYNKHNVLRRLYHREVYKHLDKVSIGTNQIILEGLGD